MNKLLAVMLFLLAAGPLFAGARTEIAFSTFPENGKIEIALPDKNNDRSVVFQEDAKGWDFQLFVASKTCSAPVAQRDGSFFDPLNRPQEAGTFPVRRGRSVFIKSEAASAAAVDSVLYAFSPAACAALAVRLHKNSQSTDPLPEVEFSSNWNAPELAHEKAFLLRLLPEYGYVTGAEAAASASDPKFAWYWWKRDNGGRDGKLRLRSYKGKPSWGSAEAEVSAGGITYTAWFKAGVTAYDPAADSYRPLYHPKNIYAWAKLLEVSGNYLFIGTNGDGLAIINLKTMTISRSAKLRGTAIKMLVVSPDAVLVNGSVKIPFPAF